MGFIVKKKKKPTAGERGREERLNEVTRKNQKAKQFAAKR